MEKIIKGLSCPSCGGTIEIAEGKHTVECKFCKTSSILEGEQDIPRYCVLDEIPREKVKPIVEQWFTGIDKATDLKSTYILDDIFLTFLPFYRFRSQVVGWVLGEKEERSGSGKNARTYRVPKEIRIDTKFDWNTNACHLGEFGVTRVDLEGDHVIPFDREKLQERGMVFETGIALSIADDKALSVLDGKVTSIANLTSVSYKKYHELCREISIIFYPLWVFRYRYRNRLYQVVVDAEDGSLVYGKAPGNNMFRIGVFTASMVFSNYLLTSVLRSGARDGEPYIFAFLAAIVIVVFGYHKFRYGKEVIYTKYSESGTKNLFSFMPSMK